MTQAAQSATATAYSHPQRATLIPAFSAQEIIPLARVELERFLALIEPLSPADLSQPTDCALWTVKDVIAHQASHVYGFTRTGEFIDQFNPLQARAYTAKGMNPLDAANQRQVDLRAGRSLAQLIAEMRDHAEASFAGRTHMLRALRWLPIPVPGSQLRVSIGALFDNVYTRDMWMHRADICRATGREMTQTAEHDGRIVALIVRELDGYWRAKLGGRAVALHLSGKAGGAWTLGGDGAPAASVRMDVLEFNRLASGRINAAHALENGLAKLEGDAALARAALQNTVVLY